MGIFDNAEMKAAKRQYKGEMKLLADIMKPTGKIFMCAKWDDNLRVISIGSMGMSTIVKYDTIKDIQVYESVQEVTSTKSSGREKRKGVMTRAAVGTILLPGAGTLAGALTAKKQSSIETEAVTSQQVTRDDPFKTVLTIPYNQELEVKLRSILAENLSQAAPVEQIAETPLVENTPPVEQLQQIEQPVSNISVADELIKLKELLDAGVLTEEEFATQKQRLLR